MKQQRSCRIITLSIVGRLPCCLELVRPQYSGIDSPGRTADRGKWFYTWDGLGRMRTQKDPGGIHAGIPIRRLRRNGAALHAPRRPGDLAARGELAVRSQQQAG